MKMLTAVLRHTGCDVEQKFCSPFLLTPPVHLLKLRRSLVLLLQAFLCLQEVSEPSKEEKAVAKYLRFNCATKSTNMMGHRVDYFIGESAVAPPMCLLLLWLVWAPFGRQVVTV